MQGTSRTQLHRNTSFNRRALLKSAAGAFIGASTLHFESQTAVAERSGYGRENDNSGQLRKRMLGFMLPHEQFPVPELINLGVAAE